MGKRLKRYLEMNHVFEKAVEIYARINRVNPIDLYTGKQNRPLVETRSHVWAYMRQRTQMTTEDLGERFGKHHCTVVHHGKQHHMYMSNILSKRHTKALRVNEFYAENFESGAVILDRCFSVDDGDAKGYQYRVVMMVDDYPEWIVSKVIEVEKI